MRTRRPAELHNLTAKCRCHFYDERGTNQSYWYAARALEPRFQVLAFGPFAMALDAAYLVKGNRQGSDCASDGPVRDRISLTQSHCHLFLLRLIPAIARLRQTSCYAGEAQSEGYPVDMTRVSC